MMNLAKNIFMKYPISINLQFIQKISNTNSKISDKSKYVTVYKFKHARLCSIINKLKLYQTILTGTCIPTSELLNTLGFVNSEVVYTTAIIGFAGCGALYSIGHFTSKIIGFMYYNEEKNMAKIAYVDYWGKRKDIEVPTDDLVPLSELPKSVMDVVYYNIKRYSTKDTLKLTLQYAEILDSDKFNKML